MGRAPCCEKVGLKRGRWTAEEDEILMRYIQEKGEGSWRSLPKNAGLLRCGKSCRLRWINYLRADLKRGDISPEEEEIIIKLHCSFGNRWSLIAGHLPGRTDNEIKNYWNSHLSRRIHSLRRPNNDGAPMVVDLGEIVGGCRRRRGRISRSAMKKNNISSMEMKRSGNPIARSGALSYTPRSQRREASRAVSSKNVDEAENMATGPCQDNEELLDPCEERTCAELGPHQGKASPLLGLERAVETGKKQGGISVPNKEMESGAVGLLVDEREHGVLGSNEVTRESGRVGGNEKSNENEMGIDGWSTALDAFMEEMGCLQDEFWMGWEGDRLENQQSEDGGELWSWLWESDNEEGYNSKGSENEQESYASWLLSANDL